MARTKPWFIVPLHVGGRTYPSCLVRECCTCPREMLWNRTSNQIAPLRTHWLKITEFAIVSVRIEECYIFVETSMHERKLFVPSGEERGCLDLGICKTGIQHVRYFLKDSTPMPRDLNFLWHVVITNRWYCLRWRLCARVKIEKDERHAKSRMILLDIDVKNRLGILRTISYWYKKR